MKNQGSFWIVVSAVVVCSYITGCGSSRPAKYYSLYSVESTPTASSGSLGSQDQYLTVGIGPIEIPDYMDRPQVVTRMSQHEFAVNEYERWAGSFETDVRRVVMENLSLLLAEKQVYLVPWAQGGIQNYRLSLDVARFDAVSGGEVFLSAKWTIYNQDGRTVAMRRLSNIKKPLNGRDVTTTVTAMSQALGSLCQDMANGLTSVLSERNKGESK